MDIEINYDLNTFLADVSLDYKLSLGSGATGDTPMYWGDVVSGTGYFYFQENGTKRVESGSYYFNTGNPEGAVFSSGKYTVTCVSREAPESQQAVSIGVGNTDISFNSGGYYVFNVNLPAYANRPPNVVRVSISDSGSLPTINADGSNLLLGTMCWNSGSKPKYTTSNAVHNRFPDVPYLPISNRNLSYNDLRLLLLDAYNEQNPEETISINDLPEFDEQDNTEPSYDIQPFSIDYDEILGEKEMESIIAETRYVLDTTPYEIESVDYNQAVSEPYAELKKNAVLDADTKTAISKIYDVAIAMSENDFLPLYAFGAILSIIMWFVFRR